MSTFGWSHLSGVGSITTASVTVPGGPNQAVQYNKNGAFAGDSTMTFDDTVGTKKLTVDKVKPNVIIDSTNSVGTAGQVLSSTGTGLAYINLPVVPVLQRGQFSSVPRSYGAGSFSCNLDTETFSNGVQLSLPPPIAAFEVTVSGNYLVTYNLSFTNTNPSNADIAIYAKRISIPNLSYGKQQSEIGVGSKTHIGNSEIITMSVGELFCIQVDLTNTIYPIVVSDINVVVQRVD
jgi:hypothetical protein